MSTTCVPVVYVVDDDVRVLDGVGRLLRVNGIQSRTYSDAERFLQQIDIAAPGCVVLDLTMPRMSGLEVHERLMMMGCSHPVVFLSGFGTVELSVRAMKAGAVDFIEKPFSAGVLLQAVRRGLERDAALRANLASETVISRRLALLTPREGEVLRHVIAGRMNKAIAARIGAAEKTVKVHRARVMRKMAVRSVAELTRLTIAVGVRPEP